MCGKGRFYQEYDHYRSFFDLVFHKLIVGGRIARTSAVAFDTRRHDGRYGRTSDRSCYDNGFIHRYSRAQGHRPFRVQPDQCYTFLVIFPIFVGIGYDYRIVRPYEYARGVADRFRTF
jgi:hypothetical protein